MYSFKKLEITIKIFIFSFIILGFYNAIIIGASWDEPFHHTNGISRLNYLLTFGKFKDYDFYPGAEFYPGLYDTISASVYLLVEKININFAKKFLVEIKHVINYFFFIFSLLGLYKFIKILLKNELIALLSCALTLFNPFFFGHSGMNPKDIIIFFSLVWFLYFFILYISEYKSLKNLIYFSFFIGFGCGTRLSFLSLIFPIIIFGIFFYVKKFDLSIVRALNLKKLDFLISVSVLFLVAFTTWPHIHSVDINLIINNISKSLDWHAGPKQNLINGIYYLKNENQLTYLISLFLYKVPLYQTLLFIISLIIVFFKKNFFIEKLDNFLFFFWLNFTIIFYTFSLVVFFQVAIYDNFRLILFIIPFFCTICSISIYYFICSFDNLKIKSIFFSLFIFIFFIFSIFRYLSLNPYQYTYLNFSVLNLNQTKYENDYWGTSFKELVKNMPKKYNGKNIEDYTFFVCGGDPFVAGFYLYKKFKKIKISESSDKANLVIQTNRASFDPSDKRTCFDSNKGIDLVVVERQNMILSKITFLN